MDNHWWDLELKELKAIVYKYGNKGQFSDTEISLLQ